jgi:hypothetical protein
LRFYWTYHDTQHSGACQVQSSVGRVTHIPLGITQISSEHLSPILSGHRHEWYPDWKPNYRFWRVWEQDMRPNFC